MNDFNERFSYSLTALFYAVIHNRIEILELLIKHPKIKVNHRDRLSSSTAFHWACDLGNPDIIKVFLKHAKDKGINLNTRDEYGLTAFTKACGRGHSLVVNILIETMDDLGIEANVTDQMQRNAYIWACMKGTHFVKIIILDLNSSICFKVTIPWFICF